MTAPPDIASTTEPLPGITGLENDTAFSPSKGKAMLMAEFGHDEWTARQKVRDFLARRDREAREASMAEFRSWITRRGDLIVVRGRPHHPWRVAT